MGILDKLDLRRYIEKNSRIYGYSLNLDSLIPSPNSIDQWILSENQWILNLVSLSIHKFHETLLLQNYCFSSRFGSLNMLSLVLENNSQHSTLYCTFTAKTNLKLKVWIPFQHFFYLEMVQKFWDILYFQAIGDQKKEGPDAKKRQRGKIICCANNTIDEVTKSLLVNWI